MSLSVDRYGALSRAAGPYLAEAIAAFIFVFAGCGATVIGRVSGGRITHVGVAITFGLVIAAMIYAIGHISGAHINPAAPLAFALTRHFPLARVPGYWVGQFAGASVAVLVLRALFGNVAHLGTTLPAHGDRPVPRARDCPDLLPRVHHHGGGNRRPRCGAGGGARRRRHSPARCHVRRPDQRAFHQPSSILWSGPRLGTWGHLWIYVLGPILGAVPLTGYHPAV